MGNKIPKLGFVIYAEQKKKFPMFTNKNALIAERVPIYEY